MRKAIVCGRCAKRATLLVLAERDGRELATAAVLAPFVRHLYKLARAYELDDESRAEGLRQAAGMLEHGHPPQDDVLSAALAASTADASRTKGPAPATSTKRPAAEPSSIPPSVQTSRQTYNPVVAELEPLEPCAVAILAVLASAPRTWTRTAIAIESRYAVSSGSFAGALAKLRARHLIEGPAHSLRATEHGRVFAEREDLARPEGGAALAEWWAERVGTYAGTLLQILSGPNRPSSRAELAERAGYQATSGSFAGALAKLRGLGLVEDLAASQAFMAAIAP